MALPDLRQNPLLHLISSFSFFFCYLPFPVCIRKTPPNPGRRFSLRGFLHLIAQKRATVPPIESPRQKRTADKSTPLARSMPARSGNRLKKRGPVPVPRKKAGRKAKRFSAGLVGSFNPVKRLRPAPAVQVHAIRRTAFSDGERALVRAGSAESCNPPAGSFNLASRFHS